MTVESANVARFLPQMARRVPDQCAVKVPLGLKGDRIEYLERSFAEMDADCDTVARFFQEKGIVRDTHVLLMVKPGLDLILTVFALFKIGAVPVVIDPGMGLKSFLNCVRRSKPEALVGIPLALGISRIFRAPFKTVRIRIKAGANSFLNLEERYNDSGEEFPMAVANSGDLAAVLFTSGSTGPPKGVCYEHGMFDAQVRLIRDQYNIEPGEVDLPMLPIFALFNPALGMTTVVPEMNPSKPAKVDPAKIVQAIKQNTVTTSFGSPVLWEKIGRYCAEREIQLPSMRRVLIAGAPVSPDLVRLLQPVLPRAVVHTPYGATECLPVTSHNGPDILEKTWQLTEEGRGTCVGRPVPEVEVKIIRIFEEVFSEFDPALEVGEGEIGEIIVKGPVVTKSYDQLDNETAKAKIYQNGEVWHRMGDLGYFDSEGLLWFCGRKAERVVTAKGTLFTDCCEAIFNRHPDVFRSALIGIGSPENQTPAIVFEPEKRMYPKSASDREKIILELRELGAKNSVTRDIQTFFIARKFPVDVRHNAKIHRLTLAKKFQTHP